MSSHDTTRTSLPQSAEAWLTRVHSPDCTEREHEAFHDWLRADPRHRLEYEKCEAVWTLPEMVKKDPAFLAQVMALGPKAEPIGAKAAAPKLVTWRRASVVLPLVAISIWLASDLWLGRKLDTTVTAQAEQLKITLADGTHVHMNPRTRLQWVSSPELRRVDLLEGEAYFNVAKDPGRPFVVRAAETEIRVVGTQFAVRREADRVEVVVREGQVDVLSTTPRARPTETIRVSLVSGRRLRVDSSEGRMEVSAVDADRATAWRTGSLEFDGDTLDFVIAEVNRFSRKQLHLTDPSIGNTRISGRFDIGDTEGLVFNLKERFGIRVEETSDRIVLKGPSS